MTEPILPWLARHPALLDSAGAPVLPSGPHPTGSVTQAPQRIAHLVTLSALLRDFLTRCLRPLALTVADATDAPDLVLLDLAAPDALTHCRTLREQHPDLPIVALTPLTADHIPVWEAGANAVLPIPFDVLELQATITILLEDRVSDRINRINRIGERNEES